MISSKSQFPEIVRQTPVSDRKTGLALMISTIRTAPGNYDTVVFDETDDRQFAGMVIVGHEHEGRTFGPYVIDVTSDRSATRDEAMEQHREALYAARTETPKAVAR